MKDHFSPPGPGLPAGARVWAYLRDSGGPSQDQSVNQQEREIIAYCQRYSLHLMNVYRDVARSGGSVSGRDEFMAMMDASQDESLRPQALLIWNFARFSRDYNDFVYYKATLNKRGVIVHSLTDQIPHDDFAGRIVETIISLANEEKRRQTSKDVKRALKALVSEGYSPGIPPRGYMAVKVMIGERRDGMPRIVSKWEPDPVLSEYVKIAWQLRAKGKSYQEITKATHGKLYTGTNSWHSFFRNKSYLGIGRSGDLEVPDHHEPLITWELWEAVQKLYGPKQPRETKGHLHHPRRIGNPTLLSGFTYCIECGAMMVHSPGHKKNPWAHYICGQKDRHGAAACSSRRVGAVEAEKRILHVVLNQVLTAEYLSQGIDDAKRNLDSTVDIERQIKAETRRREELDIAIQRTLNAIEKTGSQAAQDRLAQREAEREQVKHTIEKLNGQLATAQMEIPPAAMQVILDEWRAQFEKVQQSGNVRDIKAWLTGFIPRIELGYNVARIFYTYPMTDLFSRNTLTSLGGIGLPKTANTRAQHCVERFLSTFRVDSREKVNALGRNADPEPDKTGM